MICDDIKAALIAAMKGGDKAGTQTIRLIQSAIKNRDIELRTGRRPSPTTTCWSPKSCRK